MDTLPPRAGPRSRLPLGGAGPLSAAFTLVELLVVIGIIGLLVGILLPALSVARRAAQSTVCQSKLHQIALAAQVHANTHRGYYPPAGFLPGWNAEMLSDPDRIKYDYGERVFALPGAGGGASKVDLLSITEALAITMRHNKVISADNPTKGVLETDPRGYIRNFLCPSHTDDPNTIYIEAKGAYDRLPCLYVTDPGAPGAGGVVVYYTQGGSYVWNEYVLGWDTTFEPPATDHPPREPFAPVRLRGRAAAVRQPAQTMLVADGLGSIGRVGASGTISGYGILTLYNTGKPVAGRSAVPVTMADALAGNGLAGNPANFDRRRHRGRVNVAFCDGHVESRAITAGDLTTAYLVPGY